ncbi:MAG: DUF4111 domain-containing protein [Lachnospiraceae bacterium]|nr:DUF4111 domain-containing protein [Lachnospiraceae bacterium]
MEKYESLLDSLVQQSKDILGDNLVGIYLHGSAVMGCFNDKKSDIDFIVVIKTDISNELKRQYMSMAVELNKQAPAKGIEFSIVRENVCNPFVYPTPFELHFSITHLNWYLSDSEDYIEKMKGTDKDLAAHFTIIYYRGKTLYGKEIKEVFANVSSENYFDSIWCDIENSKEEIKDNPTYIILNLCRVLAYKKDNLILSKQEGGNWGLKNIPEEYHNLISDALTEYQTDELMKYDVQLEKEYADYVIGQIKSEEERV